MLAAGSLTTSIIVKDLTKLLEHVIHDEAAQTRPVCAVSPRNLFQLCLKLINKAAANEKQIPDQNIRWGYSLDIATEHRFISLLFWNVHAWSTSPLENQAILSAPLWIIDSATLLWRYKRYSPDQSHAPKHFGWRKRVLSSKASITAADLLFLFICASLRLLFYVCRRAYDWQRPTIHSQTSAICLPPHPNSLHPQPWLFSALLQKNSPFFPTKSQFHTHIL